METGQQGTEEKHRVEIEKRPSLGEGQIEDWTPCISTGRALETLREMEELAFTSVHVVLSPLTIL